MEERVKTRAVTNVTYSTSGALKETSIFYTNGHTFFTLPSTNFNFSVANFLSSANAFNLDWSKFLSFGKELYS